MLDKIQFSDNDKLYILGDVLDRGPQPIDIIKYIKDKSNITLLKGNHEEMFLEYATASKFEKMNILRSYYAHNGGTTTVDQFEDLASKEQLEIVEYVKRLPLYFLVNINSQDFILVHSGINTTGRFNTVNELMDSQSDEDILWSREEFYMHPGVPDYTIVFGHTPVPYLHEYTKTPVEFKIWYDTEHADKIGIDCGAVFEQAGGQLACMRLDDQEEFYIKGE